MKKILLASLLLSIAAHSADSPQAAMTEYIDSLFAGDTARSMALTYIPPELLAAGVEENTLKQSLSACYNGDITQATAEMKSAGATLTQVNLVESSDTLAYVQAVLTDKDGNEQELPTLAVYPGASGWQVDIIGELLRGCEAIAIGDPRDVVARYLDAWARDDGEAAFALIEIPPPYFTDSTPSEMLTETRAKFGEFYRDHANRRWRLADKPAKIEHYHAYVEVIDEDSQETSPLTLTKTSRGWRLEDW